MKTFKTGFTVAELLIVIVVIVILTAITSVGYRGMTARGVNNQLIDDTRKAGNQIELDYSDSGLYPANAAAVNSNKGFQVSNGTIFTYIPSGDRKAFCLQASSTQSGTKTYKVIQDSKVEEGFC